MQKDIEQALKVLHTGGLILYPTDTIWGIGCDATNAQAVERIYQLKQRHDSKAMLLLLDSENRLLQYVSEVPEIAWQLIEVADKPMTIIYPGAKNLPSNLVADDGSIGIRITEDKFCKELIGRFKKPIVSTSANISGGKSPSNFAEIEDVIFKGVDFVVQWRQNEIMSARPSSILKLGVGGEVQVIRK